jgi:predicted helicase
MIDGADWLCEQHFGKSLIERDVEILDPATGTGTFICELLEHFRGQPKKLERKYREELHANEVAILPYYVANLNIEATYAAITGQYDEFANLCFVDTLDNVGLHTLAHGSTADLFGSVSDENVARIKRQNSRKISVIIGNPPYNANQANENDNNKNREYPAIDARIKQTYIAESTAQKTKLYDMYARFFRWASDRLDANGVLAFVTNRSFLDSRTFDGFRKTVASEFAEVRVLDLGGDVRANPKLSGTRHNVFGIQTGVAISFFVKKAGKRDRGRFFYARRPERETAEEKLAFLSQSRLATLDCEEVRPDAKANWLNLTHNDFDSLMPIADKEARSIAAERAVRAMCRTFSLGASTNRDEWLMDFAPKALLAKIAFLGTHYESRLGVGEVDETIKWSETLLRRNRARQHEPIELAQLTKTLYRPYVVLDYYNSPLYVDRPGRASRLFLQPNRAVCFMAGDRQPFSVIAAGALPNLNMFSADACQCVPEWEVAPDGGRIHNITDWALKQFTSHYKAGPGKRLPEPTKEGIFHYVYAVLHDPVYRDKYAQNLKREFPRVPLYGLLRADFWRWAD